MDDRNFHCWRYRHHIAQLAGQSPREQVQWIYIHIAAPSIYCSYLEGIDRAHNDRWISQQRKSTATFPITLPGTTAPSYSLAFLRGAMSRRRMIRGWEFGLYEIFRVIAFAHIYDHHHPAQLHHQ